MKQTLKMVKKTAEKVANKFGGQAQQAGQINTDPIEAAQKRAENVMRNRIVGNADRKAQPMNRVTTNPRAIAKGVQKSFFKKFGNLREQLTGAPNPLPQPNPGTNITRNPLARPNPGTNITGKPLPQPMPATQQGTLEDLDPNKFIIKPSNQTAQQEQSRILGPAQQEQAMKNQLMPPAGQPPQGTPPVGQPPQMGQQPQGAEAPAQDSSAIDQQIAALQKQIADLQAQKK